MPSRILVLNERDPRHPQAGGAELHVQEIFRRLRDRGHAVEHLAVGFGNAPAREEIDGVVIRRLGPLPLYYPRAVAAVVRETRAGRHDVVVECLNKVPFYSPLYSAAPVVAIVHHLFGEVAFQQKAWPIAAAVWTAERGIPRAYRNVPIVSISESTKEEMVARGLRRENIRVSYCGIERPALAPEVATPRPPVVTYLGRLEPYKRIDLMLDAVAMLAARFPELEVLVIGRGSARSALEARAQRLGIAERTRFTGFVSDEERDALLARTRVCVCASEKEGWGLTVIESNATGTPVVAADAPGLRESVRHGETGFLVAQQSGSAYAEAIERLLADDELATRMSAAALAWSEKFDWDVAASEMADAIAAVRRNT